MHIDLSAGINIVELCVLNLLTNVTNLVSESGRGDEQVCNLYVVANMNASVFSNFPYELLTFPTLKVSRIQSPNTY